jgi:hypothetical protein
VNSAFPEGVVAPVMFGAQIHVAPGMLDRSAVHPGDIHPYSVACAGQFDGVVAFRQTFWASPISFPLISETVQVLFETIWTSTAWATTGNVSANNEAARRSAFVILLVRFMMRSIFVFLQLHDSMSVVLVRSAGAESG